MTAIQELINNGTFFEIKINIEEKYVSFLNMRKYCIDFDEEYKNLEL